MPAPGLVFLPAPQLRRTLQWQPVVIPSEAKDFNFNLGEITP